MSKIDASPVIVDCDTGRDDALTLWYAIAKGLKPKAVVGSYGNTSRTHVIQNCLDVLSLAHCEDVPVFLGASKPSRDHPLIERMLVPKQGQSGNGLCNVVLPKSSAEAFEVEVPELASRLEVIAEKEGPLDYLIVGPATTAWQLSEYWGDRAADIVKHFTMLGGRFGSLWQETPIPDFNIGCDPFALRGLLGGSVPVRLVTLNTTWAIQLPLESVRSLVTTSLVGETAKTLMEQHCLYFSSEPVFRFHDPTTIYALLHEQHFYKAQVDVNVDVNDGEFGRLVVGATGSTSTACIFSTSRVLQSDILVSILKQCGLK